MEKFEYILINDIETKILDNPIPFIAMDGREYATSEEMARANSAYFDRHFKRTSDSLFRDSDKSQEFRFSFKGADGKEYPTLASLIEADRAYWESQKVSDLTKLSFIGLDGKEYSTSEALLEANKRFRSINYAFIGPDGKEYSTSEALQAAKREWNRQFNRKIDLKDFLK